MGMEDYGVLLRPTDSVPIQDVEALLLKYTFTRDEAKHKYGNAYLPTPFVNQATYTRQDSDNIIEALVKSNSENTQLKYISVRFAICQPSTATDIFLTVIVQLVNQLHLYIDEGTHIWSYSDLDVKSYSEKTHQKVRDAKAHWSKFFEGDAEELAMPVEQAWSYFRKKHPSVFKT